MGIAKWLHNISGGIKNYGHGDIADTDFWEVPTTSIKDRIVGLETLFSDVSSGIVTLSNDGVTDIVGNATVHWNFLKGGSITLDTIDPDTLGIATSPKFAPDGWHQQYFETEFETSNIGADSIHEKDWHNVDLGFSTLKFYDVNEVLLTTQVDIDANCVRTDLLWMPTFDYSIKSGWTAQKTVPDSNVYVWVVGADLDAAYGGPQATFAEGGINLTYVDSRTKAGLDGVAASRLNYNHPSLGDGAGTNRIRFIVRHNAGFKHRLQIVLEIFLA